MPGKMPHHSTKIIRKNSSSLYKGNEKPGWKHNKNERGQVERGEEV
jgi:hypothetical protein